MFQTDHSAAFPILYNPDISYWNWVELAVDAPFFMLEIASKIEDDDFITYRMTASLKVLRGHTAPSETEVLKRVFLISPGYVNGSDSFQMHALDSVRLSPSRSPNMLFKLTDGRTLHFSLLKDRLDDSQYTDLVYKLE